MSEEVRPVAAANLISGDIAGTAVQAGSITGGLHFHITAAPESATDRTVDPPTEWADLPELPPKIQSLLRAQIQAAEEMPYRLPGARRPSLSTVYVRQDVTSGTEAQPAEQGRLLPVLDSRGQLIDLPHPPVTRLVVRPPSRSMREALDGDDHLLVTGGPGQGKSTLSLRLTADVARCWQAIGDSPPPLQEIVVPLRLTARELAARLDLPFFEALAETVRGEYGALLAATIQPDDLGERVGGCRWLLLVDGLDEVADTVQRDRLVSVLSTWASDSPDYRVVLTTRPIEGATLAPFQRIGSARYELLPFDEHALRRFAEHWFSDSPGAAAKFLRQLRKAHLDELVRVPLLATIAAIIFEQFDDRPLPDNQYELYETYLGYLRSAHPVPEGLPDEHCGRLLEHLGHVRLEEDTSLTAAACHWTAERLPELCRTTGWREKLVTYLAAVGPFIWRAGDLWFLHHSFAEHLAATAKARLLPPGFDPGHADFVELLHAARPEDRGRYARRVLLHHTRLHPAEADALLSHLHAGAPDQHLLAARLLAWHIPAGAEAFFATAHAWAMTTQYPGREILSQVSRATHHPGLLGWLLDLMRDDEAPWPSRVEAAIALATRLNTDARPEALEVLRAVVHDAEITVRPRLDAAEALSECGADERGTAIHGLRSILTTPSATATQYSNAAVVLAGLGPEARAEAVDALTRLLEDQDAPDWDLVEAAVGLVEIGSEFHERCAAVFRMVLDRRSWSVDGVEEAALGLASLGPDQLAETAAALERRITDHRLDLSDRLQAARVLVRLGPQHRVRAGELVLGLATNPVYGGFERASIANALIGCGPEFQDPAMALLRSVLEMPITDIGGLQMAARTLAELGPGHRAEAANAFLHLTGHPLANTLSRINALGGLTPLGESYRAPALSELQATMIDRGADPEARVTAASEISRLGPEFHGPAIEQLEELTSPSLNPGVRSQAWRLLSNLSPRLAQRAYSALSELLAEDGWEAHRTDITFYRADTVQPDDTAETLLRIIRDATRSGQHRCDAAHVMRYLGRRYQSRAAQGIMEMLRDDVIPKVKISTVVAGFSGSSARLRRDLTSILRSTVLCPRNHASLVCEAATAIARLDALNDTEILDMLAGISADTSVDADTRCTAALLRAQHEPERLPDAAALVLKLYPTMATDRWVRELVEYGADVTVHVRALVADPLVSVHIRQRSAALLAELRPDLYVEAASELMAQATDEFLAFSYRSDAMIRLVKTDPGTLPQAIDFHRAVMSDGHEYVQHRCEAAYELARLDPTAAAEVRDTLLELGATVKLTPGERGVALSWLGYVSPADTTTTRLRLALAYDPAASGSTRTRVARDLPGKQRREVEHAIVADRLVPADDWPGTVTEWDDISLAGIAAREFRDLLAGPELTVPQRIEAAVALSGISPRFVPEAVAILSELSRGRTATDKARQELMWLNRTWYERVLADARAVLADGTRPGRERARAGLAAATMTSEPFAEVHAQLAALLEDDRIAKRLRLGILFELDRLDDLRAIRDDLRETLIIRRQAAHLLRGYSTEDRAAAARVFQAIADDPFCHPTLRWWAADDLAECGSRGQALGTEALRALMTDNSLPVIARRDAARALGHKRPDLRGEVLAVLRSLRNAGNPFARIQILQAIGAFEPTEGALGLGELAQDREITALARLRAAWAAAESHRDHRETAAIVVREIAHDGRVPRHIRVEAARLLTALSEICRSEARQLLEAICR
ncbi:NACHT domain-containing protein [Amycolatopsis azurea]|nr:NACHT domain-containing protein [Amycolatopsis azurea]